MIVSEERAAWLAGLKVGDAVMAHGAHSPPAMQRVAFTDHTRIFYGDADAPDWVWKHTGYALLDTATPRWIDFMTPLPPQAFCDLFLIASGDALERLSEEELFPDLWTDDPDFYMDCADMRDTELMLDQAGCLDADL